MSHILLYGYTDIRHVQQRSIRAFFYMRRSTCWKLQWGAAPDLGRSVCCSWIIRKLTMVWAAEKDYRWPGETKLQARMAPFRYSMEQSVYCTYCSVYTSAAYATDALWCSKRWGAGFLSTKLATKTCMWCAQPSHLQCSTLKIWQN